MFGTAGLACVLSAQPTAIRLAAPVSLDMNIRRKRNTDDYVCHVRIQLASRTLRYEQDKQWESAGSLNA